LTLDPFGTQEINAAIEETFSKQTILGFLNARLRTSTITIAAQLGILCCKCETKRGNCFCLFVCLPVCLFVLFIPFPNYDTCLQGKHKNNWIHLDLHVRITVSGGISFHQ